jgi:hypothetical protein
MLAAAAAATNARSPAGHAALSASGKRSAETLIAGMLPVDECATLDKRVPRRRPAPSMRAMTTRTHASAWSGPARAALTAALADLDLAETTARPLAMSHALARLARCYRAMGEQEVAAQCLGRACSWAGLLGAADSRLDLLCELAETLLEASAAHDGDAQHARRLREQTRDHCFEVSRLCGHCADPQWEVTVLLRVSDVLDRCGDHDDAIALQCRALQLIAQHAVADAADPESAA